MSPAMPTRGPCSCRPGIQRDNCATCEGTGRAIDWAAFHRNRRANPPESGQSDPYKG